MDFVHTTGLQMAIKKVWIGSVGPYQYDDALTYHDGVPLVGIRTDGRLRVTFVPTVAEDVLRYDDIGSLVTSPDSMKEYALLVGD